MTFAIKSFQWWFANDKNAWQSGAFWNISWLDYRKNVAYLELARWLTNAFTTWASDGTPIALTLWGNGWTQAWDIVAITTSGKVITSAWLQSTAPWGAARNAFSYGWRNFILGTNRLERLSSWTLSFFDAWYFTFTTSTDYRPVLDWFWDLLIGNGNSIARVNEASLLSYPTGATSATEYIAWTSNGCIGGLDGTVYAITQIWVNVYVWCNNGGNTNLYIWDGVSDNPSQVIKYTDLPVSNVALLGNMHYWWTKKSDQSIRTVNIGESYAPQTYIKTAFPKNPLLSNTWDDNNRMTIDVSFAWHLNSIETLNDNVYLPWIGGIYSFWQYQPWVGAYSLGREVKFTWEHVTAMVSWGVSSPWWRDFWWLLAFAYKTTWSNIHQIAIYNSGQYSGGIGIFYNTSGTYESMEFLASDMYKWEDDMKITVPFQLPHSSCSIKVYEKRDWASSYTEIKTINTTDDLSGWTWFWVAEIASTGKWRTKQLKFELITTNTDYSPRLYIGITNYTKPTWKITN